MKFFHCDHCGQPIFFENTQCINCNHTLGYLPDQGKMSAFKPGENDHWTPVAQVQGQGKLYRMCKNYSENQVCNWMIAADNPEFLCPACRLNQTIPDLSDSHNMACWSRLEAAKHRLVYTLLALGLPLKNKQDDPKLGLAFDFLADPDDDFKENQKVLTGHAEGLITINIAEADDAVREKMRLNMNERYRTVLGHFRHEIGHYYWEVLVRDSDDSLAGFRDLFGDEQQDYSDALQRHYDQGPPADWPQRYISTYATSHPWEDWAETWAHYLHMIDTLETAQAFGLVVTRAPLEKSAVQEQFDLQHGADQSFTKLVTDWLPLTFAFNSINRSMGLQDLYPFVLSKPVIDKLRFVHQIIRQAGH
jgi:hypothetical protein